ncbi:UNVERIFIED_CONTAM: hypothetical protein Slati_2967400 [Sesamum latifolium]|uniref:Transcription factor TFIIIB component B'' Myb domain-containing protein n=1 Tax=Sesamum latifolium TaxID=2727402 RepID=A0AAW2VF90_9LAMI
MAPGALGAIVRPRAVGKFQPKSKFRPPRKDSAATSLSSSQAAQTIDTAQSESSDPIRVQSHQKTVCIFLIGCAVIYYLSEFQLPMRKKCLYVISGLDVVSNDDGGWHASIEKSVTENADIFIGLEALGDFLPHTTTDMAEGAIHPSEEVVLNVHNPEKYRRTASSCSFFCWGFNPHIVFESYGDDSVDSGIPLECPPEIPAKLASRRAKIGRNMTHTASDPSQQQHKTSTSSQENEMGRSLRPRKSKTNFYELGDEAEDEVRASEEFSEECPVNSAAEEETVNNEEFQVESDSQMKKVKQKSEKPVRKRKKETESSDKDAKPKKVLSLYSAKARDLCNIVDKVLLATPEDEIDYQKVPLRDLILLAEHKEREMAVRQFGTDLSMIQQLFPDRTRRQVKLKYKKEERQHPLRLREALTNRTKEENQNADNDESIDLTGNEVDEGTSNAGDEEAKDEHIEEEVNENVANDFTEVRSPSKSEDIEDDLFIWSQYKSG